MKTVTFFKLIHDTLIPNLFSTFFHLLGFDSFNDQCCSIWQTNSYWTCAFIHIWFCELFWSWVEIYATFEWKHTCHYTFCVFLFIVIFSFLLLLPLRLLSHNLFPSSYISLGCKNCIHNLKMLSQNGSKTSLNVLQGQNYRVNTCPDASLNLSLEQTVSQL